MIPTEKEMNDALEERVGKDNLQKLKSATVAVLGLGGLGSNVAIALARAGVGKLILADFDKVDITNLNRQQYKASQTGMTKTAAIFENLKEISPYLEITTYDERITEENIGRICSDADVICEAFDDPEAKAMLVNHVLENMPDKYLVAASGMAGFKSANLIKTRKLSPKFFICGDGVSDVNDGIGLVSSRVMACASHEAHMIVRIIIGEDNE